AFGMNPFWGDGDGRIGLTAIAEEHRSLIRAGLAGIRGRSTKRNIPDRGYHSFRAEEIVLDLDDGITLDGQIIRPQGAAFHIHVAGKVDFVRV
ncbi:MAG: hypothetical protein KDB53_03210, partial [Planctomycetes bacterium]|nr:hypothetical protein [Planctomycetota bacterium]